MKELAEIIAKALVDDKDAVQVTEQIEEDGTVALHLTVAEADMGKVIGKQGRIAKAIRVVLKAAAVRADKHVSLDIG